MNLWEVILKIYRQNWFLQKLRKFMRIKTPIIKEKIIWHPEYKVDFFFHAPIPVALKAKRRGIENAILKRSLELLNY